MDKIIIGFDGSGAAAVVTWAAADAQRRRARLMVIESWHEPRCETGHWLASEDEVASLVQHAPSNLAVIR